MADISSLLCNYFLGTGLRQRYEAHRLFVREFCSSPESVRQRLRNLSIDEYTDMAMGRVVPNTLGLSGIVLGIAVAPIAAPAMIAFGEMIRLYRLQVERGTYRDFERWEHSHKQLAAIDHELDQSRRMRENIEAGRDPLDGISPEGEEEDPADWWKDRRNR